MHNIQNVYTIKYFVVVVDNFSFNIIHVHVYIYKAFLKKYF